MTITAHALVGGAIAASIPNPVLGITIATLSHPLLDMIPHWDEGWGWRLKSKPRFIAEASIDLALGVLLTYFIFGPFINNLWYLLAMIFASISWDVAEAPYLFLGWKFPPFSWVYKVQSKIQGKVRLPWGILTQVATVIAVVFLLQALYP